MSGIKKVAVSAAMLSWLMLAGCGTNSHIPEIREASFNRTAPAAAADATHEVRLGETLYSIAWRYNVDYHDLARWNGIQSPYPLRTGQKLRLSAPIAAPPANTVQVKPLQSDDSMSAPTNSADSSWLVSSPAAVPKRAGTAVDAMPVAHDSAIKAGDSAVSTDSAPSATKNSVGAAPVIKQPGALAAPAAKDSAATPAVKEAKAPEASPQSASTSWLWPTKGTIVGRFSDPSEITAGLDIAGQKGQPVLASRSGTVVYAGNSVRGYGNLVIIKHDDHFLSAYAHNDALKVKTNDTVKAGQIIATMGDTEADRSKLHFEIRQDSQAKDPQQFLPRS